MTMYYLLTAVVLPACLNLAATALTTSATDVNDCQYLNLHGVVTKSYSRKNGPVKCYAFFTDSRKTYAEARSSCRSLGGTLALPKTREMNAFLAGVLRGIPRVGSSWIGLQSLPRRRQEEEDDEDDNKFVWDDDSELNVHTDFHNNLTNDFFQEEDTDGSSLCLALTGSGKWYPYTCFHFGESEKNFVCEVSALPRLSTATVRTTTIAASGNSAITSPTTTTTTTDSNKNSNSSSSSSTRVSTTPQATTVATSGSSVITLPTTTTNSNINNSNNITTTTTNTTTTTATTTTASTQLLTSPSPPPVSITCSPARCDDSCSGLIYKPDPTTGCYVCLCIQPVGPYTRKVN